MSKYFFNINPPCFKDNKLAVTFITSLFMLDLYLIFLCEFGRRVYLIDYSKEKVLILLDILEF